MTPLTWTPIEGDMLSLWRPGSNPKMVRRGDWHGLVWHEGGAMPYRSTVRRTGDAGGRILAYRTEAAATCAAEKRMEVAP